MYGETLDAAMAYGMAQEVEMEEVTRKRIIRMLDRLPEEQLYQVLDYIEFLELKYARAAARKPDAFQEFAERVEDQLRVRSLAPKAMKGTMRLMSGAGRVLDGVRDIGKGLTEPTSKNGPGTRRRRGPADAAAPVDDQQEPGPGVRLEERAGGQPEPGSDGLNDGG